MQKLPLPGGNPVARGFTQKKNVSSLGVGKIFHLLTYFFQWFVDRMPSAGTMGASG
ncbi:MAG: hypothetical protein LBI69_04870 [Puniceicoccales bacterium]|nr:hypothetical protein [Puniceicoccales bacterium]